MCRSSRTNSRPLQITEIIQMYVVFHSLKLAHFMDAPQCSYIMCPVFQVSSNDPTKACMKIWSETVFCLLFTSGCIFIALKSWNEASAEELSQKMGFCQKCSTCFVIWLDLYVYIERRRVRERQMKFLTSIEKDYSFSPE